MSIVIPAITARMGSINYFETTMKVNNLVQAVRPPREMDNWANLGIEERMQREPDWKRIKTQLAPYLAKSVDRFFGSIIVLVYKGEIIFEPITGLSKNVPFAQRKNAERIGILTIDGGTLIVLDGQHRLLGLRMVQQGEILGDCAADVGEDEVCVIFINYESDEKTRRIFNTVNRYAKKTSRGDDIITSEDDGYAIVSRWLLRETEPLGKPENIVNWKSNTLTKRSTQFTTVSAVYETVKLILRSEDIELPQQERPAEDDLQTYLSYASQFWDTLLQDMPPYREAISDPRKIPVMRDDSAETALLFKPIAQIALVEALLQVIDNSNLTITEAIERASRIPTWSMKASIWQGVIIKQSGAIDASQEGRHRMAALVCYLIAADCISEDLKFSTWTLFNEAHGKNVVEWIKSSGTTGRMKDLPSPLEGQSFTVDNARAYAEQAGMLKAA